MGVMRGCWLSLVVATMVTAADGPTPREAAAEALAVMHAGLLDQQHVAYELPAEDPRLAADAPIAIALVDGGGHGLGLRLVRLALAAGASEGELLCWQEHDERDAADAYPESSWKAGLRRGIVPAERLRALAQALMIAQDAIVTAIADPTDAVVEATLPDGTSERRGGGRRRSISSSSDFVAVVTLSAGVQRIDREYCGYRSSPAELGYLPLLALDALLSDALKAETMDVVAAPGPAERAAFAERFRDLWQRSGGSSWWWPRERALALAAACGDASLAPLLLETAATGVEGPSIGRQRYRAVSALAAVTGKDFRLDADGHARQLDQVAAEYRALLEAGSKP